MKNKLLLFILFISLPSIAKNATVWYDITHKFDCREFAYVGKDGKCYLGPNDEIISRFRDIEKEAYAIRWIWNHGKSKEELKSNPYYNRYFTDRSL